MSIERFTFEGHLQILVKNRFKPVDRLSANDDTRVQKLFYCLNEIVPMHCLWAINIC